MPAHSDRYNNLLATYFRILPAMLFILAGLRKLFAYPATVQYFAGLGLPLPELAAPAVIAIEIVLPVLFVKGYRLREISWFLAAYTIATGFIAHQFWQAADAQFGNQFNHFFKNVAIAGAFLLASIPYRQSDAAERKTTT